MMPETNSTKRGWLLTIVTLLQPSSGQESLRSKSSQIELSKDVSSRSVSWRHLANLALRVSRFLVRCASSGCSKAGLPRSLVGSFHGGFHHPIPHTGTRMRQPSGPDHRINTCMPRFSFLQVTLLFSNPLLPIDCCLLGSKL